MLKAVEEKLASFWFAPGSAHAYGAFRVAYALVGLLNALYLFPHRHEYFGTDGMIAREAVMRSIGTSSRWSLFLTEMSSIQIDGIFAFVFLAHLALLLKFQSQLSAGILFLWSLSYSNWAYPVLGGWDSLIRIGALIILVSPSKDALPSWRLLVGRGAEVEQREVSTELPRYGLLLMRLQVFIVYWHALGMRMPDKYWRNGEFFSYFGISIYAKYQLDWILDWPVLSVLLSYATLLSEAAIPLMLLNRKLRFPAILAGIGLHLGIAVLCDLWIFSFAMLMFYIGFMEREDFRCIANRWRSFFRRPAPEGLKT